MYKLFFKLTVMLVIMFSGMAYMYMLKTGRSPADLLTPSKLASGGGTTVKPLPERPETLLNTESKSGMFSSKGGKTKIYKWTDEYGEVHYTNTPPIEDVDVETLTIDPNLNSIAGLKPVEAPSELESATAPGGDNLKNINPYSPEGVKEMMEKAKNVQDLLEQRAAKQEEALDSL